jgi:outer membrane protein OmpA-like peptidoglycan-associated protein
MTLRQRIRPNATSILLAGTALVTIATLSSGWPSASFAASPRGAIVVAQAPAAESADKAKAKEPDKRPQRGRDTPKAQAPAAQAPAKQNAKPKAAQAPKASPAPSAQQAPAKQDAKPKAAQAPKASPAPSAQQAPAKQDAKPKAAQDRRDHRRDDRANDRRPDRKKDAPTAQQQKQQPQPAPSTAQKPEQKSAPSTAQKPEQKSNPSTARRPNAQPSPAAQSGTPAAVPPPTQIRDAREFMRRDGKPSERKIDEVRKERKETREGNRVVIREGDRTIVREDNRTIIRHNESNRFAIDARNVRTERRGGNTETIVERSNGVRIVSVIAPDGRLIRRLRRDRNGRDIVIIDNNYAAARAVSMFIQLAAPVIRIPRDRYIVEMRRARPADIYGVFIAPPVEPILERYTLEQVRYNAPLRDRMPRVDLDITFETGSWQLSPEQVDRLSVIAEGLNRVIEKDPRQVFMVEGYTDAVGSDDDNLSLSDRRAEAVAVALTEQFQVPPENLVTQGYGEQYLKVQTSGPEEANRRVAVRRITPLMDQQAQNTGAR